MAVRWPLVIRRTHKWLALLVGVQALLWTLTGLYMAVIHIDIIHGDHLIRPQSAKVIRLEELVMPSRIVAAVPGTSEVRYQELLDRPVWRAQTPDGLRLFDARTGQALPNLDEKQIRLQAQRLYAGTGKITAVRLLTEAPLEMQTRRPPYWSVEFEGWSRPTLYLSPRTGELVARRHALWRIYDFGWMLHIMDYRDRSNANNTLLRVATWSTFAMGLFGAWLLVWSFPRKRKKKA